MAENEKMDDLYRRFENEVELSAKQYNENECNEEKDEKAINFLQKIAEIFGSECNENTCSCCKGNKCECKCSEEEYAEIYKQGEELLKKLGILPYEEGEEPVEEEEEPQEEEDDEKSDLVYRLMIAESELNSVKVDLEKATKSLMESYQKQYELAVENEELKGQIEKIKAIFKKA